MRFLSEYSGDNELEERGSNAVTRARRTRPLREVSAVSCKYCIST